MKRLNEDIKTGQFKNIYLLYGEEAYLRKQFKNRLTEAMLPEGDTMNYAYYEGREDKKNTEKYTEGNGIPVLEVIDLAETMPFFSERRLIVFENSGLFKTAAPKLADYLGSMAPFTCFLFVEREVDKRGKLYKAVKSKGRVVELSRQNDRDLERWFMGKVKEEGKQIQESTVRYIFSRVGKNLDNLEKEMEKLFCYTLDQEMITVSDVDAICTAQISKRIFAMVDAVAKQDKKKALDYYYELLVLKEPPDNILALLNRQFRLLLEVQALVKKGMGRKQVAGKVGVSQDVVGIYINQCRNFRKAELRAIMEEGAELEEAVKTGRLNDVMSVEIFILSVFDRG